MPALTKLEERVAADATWEKAYVGNLTAATNTGKKIPLLHVTSAEGFFTIVAVAPQELAPSDSVSGRTSVRTLAAEDMLGLGRCLYLYAGRACPEFGDVAFAFQPGCESGHKGSATPFDTGGLAAGHIKSNLPDKAAPALKGFVEQSSIELNHWRAAFARFLSAYFADSSAYWAARPCRSDPDGVFENLENGWRAWTFEIRFQEGHNICKRIAWAFTEPVLERLTEMLTNEPPHGAFTTPLQEFLDEAASVTPHGSVDFCEVMENWVRQNVLL